MDITEDFIMIYIPKTGSIFTQSSLSTMFKKMNFDLSYRFKKGRKRLRFKRLKHYNNHLKHKSDVKEHHGTYHQIPKKYLDGRHQVVTIVRNPFDGYTSRYHYGVFKRLGVRVKEFNQVLKLKMPSFPNISFEEYVKDYLTTFLKIEYENQGIEFKNTIGALSHQFIQFFAKDPKSLLKLLNEKSIDEIELNEHFPQIHFLFNENLNTMLYDYLSGLNYPEKHLAFIKEAKKENVSKKSTSRDKLLSKEIKDYIIEKEALLFKFFPHYLEDDKL